MTRHRQISVSAVTNQKMRSCVVAIASLIISDLCSAPVAGVGPLQGAQSRIYDLHEFRSEGMANSHNAGFVVFADGSENKSGTPADPKPSLKRSLDPIDESAPETLEAAV